MDTDKAYLLGLIIGGGAFEGAEDAFTIRLPYKKWGSYHENPQRAGEIAGDIMRKVSQMFRAIYGLSIQYEATRGGAWKILFEGDATAVKNDLAHYGIACEGELRGNARLSGIAQELVDDNLKRRFVAGLADTIGSMAKSHRRFTDEHQVISFEIKGCNFKFVCDLCQLLYSINCIPDQINWNHPNIQCAHDSYYAQWNKGVKLRVLLDQYDKFGAFAFRAKAKASSENRKLQSETHVAKKCEAKDIRFTPSAVHPAENDPRLPEIIRGGHYIHFMHFCAVMGCDHAQCRKIKKSFKRIGELINPFPILHKDTLAQIEEIIHADPLLAGREYASFNVEVASLLKEYEEDKAALLYGAAAGTGYPIAEILKAATFVIADEDELSGKRPKKYLQVLKRHLHDNADLSVEARKPDLLTPLVVAGNGRAALIGARNPDVYKRLVTVSPDNEYKLLVRQITEEDLRNAQ